MYLQQDKAYGRLVGWAARTPPDSLGRTTSSRSGSARVDVWHAGQRDAHDGQRHSRFTGSAQGAIRHELCPSAGSNRLNAATSESS